MSGVACAIGGAALVGAAATAYSANKNSKAISSANNTNLAAEERKNMTNYSMWRETRGISPDGTATNTQLPSWMTVRVNNTSTGPRRLVRSSSITADGRTLKASAGQTNANYGTSEDAYLGTTGQTQDPLTSKGAASKFASDGKNPDQKLSFKSFKNNTSKMLSLNPMDNVEGSINAIKSLFG